MNREKMTEFKRMFEEQRQKLTYSQALINENFYIQQDDLMDEVDMTSTELETSMRMRLRNREALFLKKIDDALKRIQEGTFGQCESCEEDIETRRLEARPITTLCVNCKEIEEHKELLHVDGHRHKSLGAKLRLA